MGSRGPVSRRRSRLRTAPPVGCVDPHEHLLAIGQLEAEAAVVERLALAYAGLAHARAEASDAPSISPGQLRLVISG